MSYSSTNRVLCWSRGRRTGCSLTLVQGTGRGLDIAVHKHWAPFTPYGLSMRNVNLDNEWRNFAFDFVAENFDVPVSDARLRFWLGPYVSAGDEYGIDNVVLAKLRDAALPVGIPVVSFPSTGGAYLPTTMTVTWNSIGGATHYHLQLSDDSSFAETHWRTPPIVDTAALLGPLESGRRYFLRVRGDSDAAHGQFGPIYLFATVLIPSPATGVCGRAELSKPLQRRDGD